MDITVSPANQTPAITTPAKGALYRVTTGGTAATGWTGLAGMQNIDAGDYVIWNGSAWDRVENTNPNVAQGTGITITPTGDTSYSVAITNTGVTAGTTGTNSVVPVITVNAQGQLTAVGTATVTPSSIGALPNTIAIATGTGLIETNGGTIANGVTISLKDQITAGTIGSATDSAIVSYNAQGQITAVSSATITPAFSNITGKPTTLAGYGITDKLTQGTGIDLSNGGVLENGVTVSIADTLTSAGSVGSATDGAILGYNKQGQITSVSSATITPAFSNVTGKPTTLAGYGITDTLTQGTGINLSNGGVLENGVSVSLADQITAGTVGSQTQIPVISYNNQGQITAVTTSSISTDFTSLTNRPSTLGGYGIVNDNITQGTGITVSNGGTLDGGVTISITDTMVSGGIAGSASGGTTYVPFIGYNQQGQITSVSSTTINGNSLGTDGMHIKLTTPSDGTFEGAVSLNADMYVTDAIESISELLIKLIPAQAPQFPNASVSLSGVTTRYLCAGTIPNNTGDVLPGTTATTSTTSGGVAISRLNNVNYIQTSSLTQNGPGDQGTVTLYLNGTANASCGPFSLAAATTHSAPLQITNNNYYPAATPGFWRSFDFSIAGTGLTVSSGYNKIKVTHSASSSMTMGTAGSTGNLYCLNDTLTVSPTVGTVTLTENTPGTLVYSSGVPHYSNGAILNCKVSNVTNLAGLACLASGSNILQIAPASLTASSFAYNQGGLPQFPFAVNYNSFTGWNTGSGQTFTLSGSNVYTSSTVAVTATNVNGTSSPSNGDKTVLYMNGSTTLNESNMTISFTEPPLVGPAYRIPSISATDYPVTSNVGTISGGTTAFVGNTLGGGDAANSYEAVVRGGVLRKDTTDYTTGFLPVGPNYASGALAKNGTTQYYTFAFQRNQNSHGTPARHFSVTITGTGSAFSGIFVKPMVNKTALNVQSGAPGVNDGTLDNVGSGYANMQYNMDNAYLVASGGVGTTTNQGWLDASQNTLVGVGQWPGQGEYINIPPYCGTTGNPSMGSFGTYNITLGQIASADLLNNLILVRIKLTGAGTITNITISN